MTIKQYGGVFGRNPTFNNVTIDGELIINGDTFTGLDYQGAWNASTNTPTLASSAGTLGEFYIVSVAGTTNLNGITNWGVGDWALFNGSVWQRVEGGADGNFASLDVSGSATFNTVYASTSVAVGAAANYQATFYKGGANANYVQVANGLTGAAAGNGILYGLDASANGVINKQGTGDLITTVAGIERLRILEAGTLDVSAANIAFDSGYGIDFSATAGTGTSELLDDYEEGDWTPAYTPTTGTFTTITTVVTGRYTKVGRLVTVFGTIRTSGTLDVTGASGNLKITGLPFACNATIAGGGADTVHQAWNLGTDILNTRMSVAAGASEILMYLNTMNGSSFPSGNITVADMSTSGGSFSNLISFTASYEV